MNRKRLAQTFLDLVRIDSPSGHEEKVREYVSKFVEKLGLKSFQDPRGNLIVKVDGFGEPLLLGAHLDTVEPGRNIKPIIEGGVIKSDGATILGADNKVAVAAILETLICLKEDKITTRPLNVVFTLSEETGEFGSTKLDYKKIKAKKGYIFDSLSPLGTIVIASPFYYRFDIKIIGKSTHASLPQEGVSALKILSVALGKIKLGKINNKTIANIGMVHGGHAINTIPGEMMTKGEVRGFVKKDIEGYLRQTIDKFSEAAKQFGGKIESEIYIDSPGYEYEINDKFIKETAGIIKKFGLKPNLEKKWACSDANIFNSNGIKVLNLGDGVSNPHTVRETVSVDNLNLLAELISALATQKN